MTLVELWLPEVAGPCVTRLVLGNSILKGSSSKFLARESKGFALWVNLATPGLPSALQTNPKELLIMHDPSLSQGGQMNSFTFAGNQYIMQNGTAETFICESKKLEDAVQEIGLQIKHHEDNIKFLQGQKKTLDDSIFDIEAALAKTYSASGTGSKNKESSNGQNELETIEEILTLNCRQLPTYIPYMKDVIGIVALLGKVDDDNLSRSLSEYHGLETMLAVVCKTHDGLKALLTYEKKGPMNKKSGLHGVGSSIGRPLDDRYLVICLENLRPYTGEFIADDPKRRLAIRRKPRYVNKETPPGFHGFAIIKSGGIFSLGKREVQIKFPKSFGRSYLRESYFKSEIRMKELKWERVRTVHGLEILSPGSCLSLCLLYYAIYQCFL
ncbi:protein DEFECTIVE IN MERISTEM SILENCING 3-like [Solanum pennellii]|uniref:Protein DEFECTIVE IN MERISTEM SILENCING 3-like n=1 Tax=Solanum pennellii TaxID=28526 RepID=A0ABM1GBR3_SOLPN|nr:protein DEFECTIVE IN MERISTEM SILENCING 3-like [Solanum pennellii]